MSHHSIELGRRAFLTSVGVAAGAVLTIGTSPLARGVQIGAKPDWRRVLADNYLPIGASFSIRPLQDGLEVWEGLSSGYLVVDAALQQLLEGSATSASPYRAATGELSYLGPGAYFATLGQTSKNMFTGRTSRASEIRAIGRDARDIMLETAVEAREVVPAVQTAATASANKSGDGLTPVPAGEVKSRVPSYGYITGCYVYPNNEGTCGWVAGSIVTRYWHARSTARKLLPTKYRTSINNLTSSPNFATYLQGSSGNSSWARDVKDRLIWNANNEGVSHSAAWALGKIGVFNSVRDGEPVIVFGNIPVGDNKKGGHAVVAYGETTGGYLITHYGWSGYNNIVLNSGLAGSNTKFRLK